MTAEVVDTVTGEVIPQCSAEEARELTDQIKTAVEAAWHLVKRAYHERAWAALGYSSWDDYCTREFGTSRLRLPREERREVVGSLREAGLSIRAIAAATGNDRNTVRGDLRQVGEIHPPAAEPDDDDDIPAWAESEEAFAEHHGMTTDEAEATVQFARAAESDPPKVTGTDGKSYPAAPRQRAKQPKRSPLPDTAKTAGWDLRKSVERLERIADDDRFTANKDQVAAHLRGHLTYAVEVCQDLLDQLD